MWTTRRYHVTCDGCGAWTPAGLSERKARGLAAEAGFERVPPFQRACAM